MNQKRKKNLQYAGAFLLVCILSLGVAMLIGMANSSSMIVDTYQISRAVTNSIRVVHLSDLHNKEFGDGNAELITLVANQKPDLIFMSGDMLNRDDPNSEIVSDLIQALSAIAPVYFGYGNHEYTWEQNYDEDLREIFTDAGATVVNNDYVDVEVNGQPLRIGGYMGYYRLPHMFSVSELQQEKELQFAEDFESTDSIKLLINHIPTQWVEWDFKDKFPVDIVFSGHYHGGTVRIPVFDRGLYAPYIGWFPPFIKGVCTGEKTACVLSAGLGSEHHIPRINNPPEIVVVDICSETN